MPSHPKSKRKSRKQREPREASSALSPTAREPKHATFSPFVRLPPELRIKIWEMTLPEEEFIVVRAHRDKGSKQSLKFSRLSPSPPPLRVVSREAYEVALGRYPYRLPILSAIQSHSIGFGPGDTICFENVEKVVKIILFDNDYASKTMPSWALNIRKLAVCPYEDGYQDGHYRNISFNLVRRAIAQFRGVHTIQKIVLRKTKRHILPELAADQDNMLEVGFVPREGLYLDIDQHNLEIATKRWSAKHVQLAVWLVQCECMEEVQTLDDFLESDPQVFRDGRKSPHI
ncbi:uncharacterized protein LY89DRAFT_677777 [Mollisia scopiformis]|uniref:2EXR domain-containing protein n=1 Tax=Mollisia scopiformis TaxID=149040 RepID=A0A132B573_MOLSC|nr:uncharacterized protein LY89DRAFT_677777 [Mollisia scopiformis]KUJ07560.1 hypothetical protein LY89DRAFT_677777 [Mollisia scopiformis]